jgi:hypothetical protein
MIADFELMPFDERLNLFSAAGRPSSAGPTVLIEPESFIEIAAKAIEILGSREKAIRWLNAPARALGNRTPVSLLDSAEGVARVGDVLGQIEHGVW